MLKDITFGQYFPGSSMLHRMDPRIKLVLTLAFIVALFIPSSWEGLSAAVGFLLFLLIASRLPFSLLLRSLKPVLILLIFTTVFNLLSIRDGAPLVEVWFIHITDKGVYTTLFIILRISALILGSSLLTFTTTPTDLTDALERLLKPLKLLRINVHELAMIMTIALRFIPTLIEETDKIMSAQKARGANMESGGIGKRIKALAPVLVPLFLSSFRRAYELALAMECRCYRGGHGRTRMKQMHMTAIDGAALVAMGGLYAAVIASRFWFAPAF